MAGKRNGVSRLSDVSAVIGGGLFLILIGLLIWDAVRASSPPVLTATVVDSLIRRDAGATYVPVDLRNEGDGAATAVVLEVSAGEGDASTTVIDYLAGHERARVVARVAAADSVSRFDARVLSYQEP